MNQEYNKKKKVTIIALSLAAICLVGGLFYYMGTLDNSAPPASQTESQPSSEVTVTVPELKPEGTVSTDSTTGSSGGTESTEGTPSVTGEVQEKPSADKPKSPSEATPPTEAPAETDKVPVENPDTSGTCQPEHTPQPDTNQPQGGETNSSGAVYVPGFGWVEDSGEENTTTVAPNAGTGDPIGDM